MFQFNGDSILYNEALIPLSAHALYLDGSLDADTLQTFPYAYNDISDMFQTIRKNHGDSQPVQVFIAPWVYWIDDPDAADTLQKTAGYPLPYGILTACDKLHLIGLTDNPAQVVIAGNRGQSSGANGNYTMFHFSCEELTMEHLTLGNYCNVDLEYPWQPFLSRKKRTSTITQAQLATFSGDRFFARGCHFISRLNLCPVVGGKRSLYYDCHFESTDDALNGHAVYEKCSFDFYGGRPLYSTHDGGAVFLDCDFYSKMMNVETEAHQYFTKESGTVTAIDCRFHSDYTNASVDFNWTKYPLPSLRCYSYGLTHNGAPLTLCSDATVELADKLLLHTYRTEENGDVLYHSCQLLKGEDNWNPLPDAEASTSPSGEKLPTQLTIVASSDTVLTSGTASCVLRAELFTFTGEPVMSRTAVRWHLHPSCDDCVRLQDNQDGSCTVEGCNSGTQSRQALLTASTADGLEGAVALTIRPYPQPAPVLAQEPQLDLICGMLKLNYSLDSCHADDESDIRWYRCTNGSAPVLTALSRAGKPETTYPLTAGDVGHRIMAQITPKSSVSDVGKTVTLMTHEPVCAENLMCFPHLYTDFHSFPHMRQPLIRKGFWTVDYFRPSDTASFGSWEVKDTETPWIYGSAGNGCIGYGLYPGTQGARLMYTPVSERCLDMSLTLTVDPAKTAGQGFGSAGQYMDICIKFDTISLSGYALRIVRTSAASNAVSMLLLQYKNGKTASITKPIIASCYQTGCHIRLQTCGSLLTAHIETATPQLADQKAMGWAHTVDLEAVIDAAPFGGICIQHTGSTGTGGWQNTTMLHTLQLQYLQ